METANRKKKSETPLYLYPLGVLLDPSTSTQNTSITALLDTSESTQNTSITAPLETSESSQNTSITAPLDTSESTQNTSITALLDTSDSTQNISITALPDTSESAQSTSITAPLETSESAQNTSVTALLDTSYSTSQNATVCACGSCMCKTVGVAWTSFNVVMDKDITWKFGIHNKGTLQVDASPRLFRPHKHMRAHNWVHALSHLTVSQTQEIALIVDAFTFMCA